MVLNHISENNKINNNNKNDNNSQTTSARLMKTEKKMSKKTVGVQVTNLTDIITIKTNNHFELQ